MPGRILVTGARGFVGRYLMEALGRKWPDARLLGVGHGTNAATNDGAAVVKFDLTDSGSVSNLIESFLPDLLIHLAAQSSSVMSRKESDLTWRTNLGGSLSLALAVARYVPDATLLFVSSSEVYGSSLLNSPVDENAPPAPLNTYAKSKAAAERMFTQVLPDMCHLIIARPFNHTGAGQSPAFVLPSFAQQISRIENGLQSPVVEVGNLDVRRDFLNVRDVVQAYVALCDIAHRLPNRFTVNICSGMPETLSDLLASMRKLSTKPFDIVVDSKRVRPHDIPVSYAEPTLMKAVTPWEPMHTISDTLNELLVAARQSKQNSEHDPHGRTA